MRSKEKSSIRLNERNQQEGEERKYDKEKCKFAVR